MQALSWLRPLHDEAAHVLRRIRGALQHFLPRETLPAHRREREPCGAAQLGLPGSQSVKVNGLPVIHVHGPPFSVRMPPSQTWCPRLGIAVAQIVFKTSRSPALLMVARFLPWPWLAPRLPSTRLAPLRGGSGSCQRARVPCTRPRREGVGAAPPADRRGGDREAEDCDDAENDGHFPPAAAGAARRRALRDRALEDWLDGISQLGRAAVAGRGIPPERAGKDEVELLVEAGTARDGRT